jgi:chorismate synthase
VRGRGERPAVPRVTLSLVTAGESHGPALVAILSGLPAGLQLEREAIDRDLRRRQEGYGRSPRQQIESDEVEVLAGLRHGRTLGTPLALVVRNRDHVNWEWGMSPWPPAGEPVGKGEKPVTLPRPGHADLAGAQKYGLTDARDALERASARHTAVAVAGGAVAKALLREIGIEVEGAALPTAGADTAEIDAARADRDTLGGIVEVRAQGVPPGLGSYASKDTRLDARLAAALMGIQAVKGVEIGDGFALARLRGSEAHDEIEPDGTRATNRAGGIEGGVSNGEELVMRAAMKPLPTLMRPLRSVDLETGEPGEALVERSDTSAVEALAVVAEAAVAFELARAAREKFGGDALGDFVAAHRAYLERIDWAPRTR